METMEQKMNQYIEYEKSKLQPYLLKYYMLDCYLHIENEKIITGKFAGISEKNIQGCVTIRLYQDTNNVIELQDNSVIYRTLHHGKSPSDSVQLFIDFTQFHKRNLLLLWIRLWKNQGLISDVVYHIYTFLIQNKTCTGELIYQENGYNT